MIIKATVITEGSIATAIGRPGTLKFSLAHDGTINGCTFWCPCCGQKMGGVRFAQLGHRWNGRKDRATISPMIKLRDADGSEHWAGFLLEGDWVKC